MAFKVKNYWCNYYRDCFNYTKNLGYPNLKNVDILDGIQEISFLDEPKTNHTLKGVVKINGFLIFAIVSVITIGIIPGVIFLVLGLLILLGAWIYWKRAKRMIQGKFY